MGGDLGVLHFWGYQKTARFFRLDHLNGVGSHPNVELLKSFFESFLEIHEELAVFEPILHVHVNTAKVIAKYLALTAPDAADDLGFARDGTEALFQLCQSIGE
jgi:hypothetical protein